MIEAITAGLAALLTPQAMLFMLIGVIYGLVIGILPGLGGVVAMALLLLALLAPLAHARSVKPAIALFLISAAIGAHFMGSYGVVIDSTMLTNALQTNVSEVRDLLSLPLLASVLVLAELPWLALQRRGRVAA